MDDQLKYGKELYDVIEEFNIPVASEDVASYYVRIFSISIWLLYLGSLFISL